MSEYPEHEKQHKIVEYSQICGEFIDWLQEEKGIELAEHGKDTELSVNTRLYPTHTPLKRLLAEFFEIDLVRLEREKMQMLEAFRHSQ